MGYVRSRSQDWETGGKTADARAWIAWYKKENWPYAALSTREISAMQQRERVRMRTGLAGVSAKDKAFLAGLDPDGDFKFECKVQRAAGRARRYRELFDR